MAKQRNSLGLLVLPVPHGGSPISWAEYKEQTGIDLEKIFEVVDLNDDPDDPIYMVQFKSSCTKIIALSFNKYLNLEVPCVSTPMSISNSENSDKSMSSMNMTVYYGDVEGGYHLRVTANKTIQGGDI